MTSSGTRLLVISADCHAGPADMRGYRDYVEARHLQDFDEYCRAIEAFYPVLVGAMAEKNWDYSRPRWLNRNFGI